MTVGIPWCRKENYNAFRSILEDRNDLPLTWEEFVGNAEKAEKFYQDSGDTVMRVDIDPKTFPAWCAENGYGINSRARVEFAWRKANPKESRSTGA